MTLMWTDPVVIEWTQRLLDSYRQWTSRDLIEPIGEADVQAYRLFHTPFVVVSHGAEADPILNYGNQVALDLWAMPWGQLVQTPSRLTAEPVNRAEREGMLAQAKSQGYFDSYRGVRVTSTGRRFLVENAFIWNIVDAEGKPVGQAATFSQWTWLP